MMLTHVLPDSKSPAAGPSLRCLDSFWAGCPSLAQRTLDTSQMHRKLLEAKGALFPGAGAQDTLCEELGAGWEKLEQTAPAAVSVNTRGAPQP